MQHIIIGNFGNHSIAALQYLLEHSIAPIHFLYVDTGWADVDWEKRIDDGQAFAEKHQVHFIKLHPPKHFEELVLDRKQFPSPKFQWCVSFLKALPIMNYLDEIDPGSEATIVSGKRRIDGRRFRLLDEFPDDDAYFDGRRLWNPFADMRQDEFKALIERAGFEYLPYPAQACSPCIHNSADCLSRLPDVQKNRLARLESEVNEHMFDKPINSYSTEPTKPEQQNDSLSQFDMGCGSPWGCGE